MTEETKRAEANLEEGTLSSEEAKIAQGGIIIDITGAGLKATTKIGTTTTKFGGGDIDD
jgi:hypothetical protein